MANRINKPTKKTALQELIFWLNSGWKDEDVNTVIKKAEELLSEEATQIIDAYDNGADYDQEGKIHWGVQYYEETFNQKENA